MLTCAEGFRKVKVTGLLAFASVWAAIPPRFAKAVPQEPDRRQGSAASRAEIERICASYLARLEVQKEWERRLSAQRDAIALLSERIKKAEERRKSAVQDKETYEKTYHEQIQARDIEVASALLDLARVVEQSGAHPLEPDCLVIQTAELRLAQAWKARDDLERYIRPKEQQARTRTVEDASDDLQDLKDSLDQAQKSLAELERQAAEALRSARLPGP